MISIDRSVEEGETTLRSDNVAHEIFGILAGRTAVVGCSALFAVAVLSVHIFISPLVYDFLGTLAVPRSISENALLVMIAALPSVWLPLKSERPSLVLLWLMYLSVYIPTIVVSPHTYAANLGEFSAIFVALVGSMFGLSLPYLFEVAPIRRRGLPIGILTVGLLSAGALWMLYSALVVGLNLSFVSQVDLYDDRFLLRDQLAIAGEHIWQYLTKWAAQAVAPALLGIGLAHRRILPVVMAFVLAHLTSSTSAGRAPMVALAFAFAVPFWTKFSADSRTYVSGARIVYTIWGALAAVLIWDLLNYSEEDPFYTTHLVFMRLFVVPGMLSGYHFDYFSTVPPAFFGESILGWLFGSQDGTQEAVALSIGRNFVYSRDVATVANANTWADWYGNLGLVGIPLSSVVLGTILYLVDRLAVGRDLRLVAVAAAPIGLNVANAGIHTVFITGGIWLTLVILWLLPEAESARAEERPAA